MEKDIKLFIEVNGIKRPRFNALNKPIHKTDAGIINFWRWFGESKTVDNAGRPRVMYHGTNRRFNKVDIKKGAMNTFWFSTDRDSIHNGESGAVSSKVILELYVRIANPAGWNEYESMLLVQLKQSFDGCILPSTANHYDGFIFDPIAVKAVKNNGAYDKYNLRIDE